MNITDVKIRKITDDAKLRAVVSMTIDNEFVIHDVKVISSAEKMFIAMPSRRMPDGEYRDIAHPIAPHVRQQVEQVVLDAYYNALASAEASAALETEAETETDEN